MTGGWLLALALCVGFVLGSCASTPDGRGEREPVGMPGVEQPGAADQLWLAVASPTDSNANGFADTFQVIVYLFPDRNVSAIPIWAQGRFDFELRDSDGQAIDRWVFPPDATVDARQQLAPGPGFSFFLRLSADREAREPEVGTLNAIFTPSDQSPRLEAIGAASVRVGGR